MNSLLMSLALMVVVTSNAHAYIDPGSGSMALQIVLGMTVGFIFTMKRKIKELLARFFKR